MRAAVIAGQPGEVRAAVCAPATGALLDLLVERADCPNPVGDRFRGRVTAWSPGLRAAFVDIGLDRPGLLPAKAAHSRLIEGASVTVEAVRAPTGEKGAKLAEIAEDEEGRDAGVPARLFTAPRLGRFLARHAPASVTVSGETALSALRTQAPDMAGAARVLPPDRDAFADADLDAAVEALLMPEVTLPDGGRLRIEPVTTLTAIDVDSGGADPGGGSDHRARAANLAAVPEIARQIRLRGLSGLIVVDFLGLESKAARAAVTTALQDALAADPEETEVAAMRPSGLVEIARQRLRPALHEIMTVPCGLGGGGRVKSAVSVAHEALRTVAAAARATPAPAWRLVAAPAVVAALRGVAAPARAALDTRLGAPLALEEAPARGGEDYHVSPVRRA